MKNKSTLKLLVSMSVFLLIGCDASGQLPSNAEVRIAPAGHSIDITQVTNAQGACLFNPSNYVDTPFLVSVHDGQGSPIGEAEINIDVEYSGNSYLGPPVLSLFADTNQNGVVDEETELVTGTESNGYVAETSKYHGEKNLLLRINLSCPFKGNIYVRSQFALNTMNVQVNAVNVVTIELPESE